MSFFAYCGNCWKIIKEQITITMQLVRGLWLLSKLPQTNIVTIFGGTNLEHDNIYAQQAHKLAHMLADNGIPILTGGGSGIMHAANCGAKMGASKGTLSMGIGVEGLEDKNACTQLFLKTSNFSARKQLLTQYSKAFAIFPGGFGTLNELSYLVTLIKTKKIKGSPIILFGTDFWQPFVTWLTDHALPNNLISENDIKLLKLVNDVDEAYEHIVNICSQKC